MKTPLKFFDIIIILIAFAFTFFSAYSAYKKEGDLRVVIQEDGGKRWRFPIDANETVIVSGPLGETVIKISGKTAWVESSPCGNLTCVATGRLSRQGQWAACLPNKAFVIIEGAKDDIDSVAW
jgi:hypothetical protein